MVIMSTGIPIKLNMLLFSKSFQSQFFIMDSDNCFVDSNGNGTYEVTLYAISREDMIELANLLSNANSNYLRSFGITIESELMEIRNN